MSRITGAVDEQRRQRLPILFLVLFVPMFTVCCLAQSPAAVPDDRPFLIQTAPSVDQNLFLLYVLGDLYRELPPATAPAAQQTEWIATTRTQAEKVRSLIRRQAVDPAIDELYRDCLDFTSAYATFLEHTRQIRIQRDQYLTSDAFDSAIKAYRSKSEVQDAAAAVGASDDHASMAGAVAGILSGMGEIYSRNQQRDSAANAAIAAEARGLSEKWTEVNANAQTTSALLAERYGWARPEADFDNLTSSSLGSYAQQMPRNPFAASAAALALRGNEQADEGMRRAVRCFHAAEMVPAADVYREYTELFVYQAATLAVKAASMDAATASNGAGPLPTSGLAVQFVRTYLSFECTHDGGAGYLLLSRALGSAGRYADAVAADEMAFQIAPDNKNDAATALRHAGLLSLSGYVDDSANWLAKALSLGFHDLAWVAQDPALLNLRQTRPRVFEELTTVKLTSPQFIWGLLLDDVQLRNDSRFDLTNLSASVVVWKAGRTYSIQVQCPLVKAGGVCRANNVVSIPGDSYDQIRWSYTSDQGAS